ncbi:MAG: DNA polymerase ligase N-terminal domain-containing protein [Isosphaeraceae bacterium]
MPRFVLLEHTWNGIHWDFMLERPDGSSLRTWAVDSPVVPDVDLPARDLAEHRTAYLDYEGEVSGGRGSVRRVDGGEYEALTWSDDRVEVRIRGVQLVGTVELRRTGSGTVDGTTDRRSKWIFRFGNFA